MPACYRDSKNFSDWSSPKQYNEYKGLKLIKKHEKNTEKSKSSRRT